MTTRERWLTAGLIVTGLLVVVLWLWQHARYSDAGQAVRQYVRLEERAEKDDEADPAAVARDLRPEIRRNLTRGDFRSVLKRLAALQEEGGDGAAARRGKAVAIDQLWPPKSPERERARTVLRSLVEKQARGYDMEAAQESLVQVADYARSGKKTEALASFQAAEARVRDARLRPGFTTPAAAAPDTASAPSGAKPAAAGMPQATARQIRGIMQYLQLMPQLIAQAPPEQRPFLERLQKFGTDFVAAYRQNKDVRPVLPVLMKLGKARNDPAAADRLLDQAWALLRAARPLPAGSMPVTVPPPAGLRAGPGASAPPGAAPVLPPAGGIPPGGPRGLPPGAGERLLAALDQIRKLPEPVYRQQRGRIPMLLLSAVSGGSGGAGAPPAIVSAGAPDGLRLDFAPFGAVAGLRSGETDFSAGLPPGELALQFDGGPAIPVRAPIKSDGKGIVQQVAGPEGVLAVTCRQEGKGLVLDARTRREREGKPGALLLRLPLRAAGWRWGSGDAPQVIAVDGTYVMTAGPDGVTAPVVLTGRGAGLSVTAPTAASIAFDPAANRLEIRLPLPGGKGVKEHLIHLAPAAGTQDRSAPAAPG